MTIKIKPTGLPAAPASPAQITEIQTDLSIVTSSQVSAIIAANTSLGAMAPAVQALIDAAVQNLVVKGSSILNLALISPSGANLLTGDNITDPTSGLTVTAALAAIRASIQPGGATAPVVNAAPTLAFPGGTGDVGETATITQGTYTGGTVTGRKWNINVNGSIVNQVTNGNTFVIPASAGTGARQLSVTELYSWANGIDQVGLTSITATVNAPVALPVNTSAPTWGTGSPVVGTTFTLNAGIWTNTPTSYLREIRSAYISEASPGTLITSFSTASTTSSYTILSSDAGADLCIREYAINASGTSLPSISSHIIITASSGAPQWVQADGITPVTGAVLPGFDVAMIDAGGTININVGTTVPAASSYNDQLLRDGSIGSPAMPGGSGANAVFSYVTQSVDGGHTVSATITPVNAGGAGRSYTIPGVIVNGSGGGGGGGGTGILSGSVTTAIAPGSTVDITAGSTTDWEVYTTVFSAEERRSAGSNSITANVTAGGTDGSGANCSRTITWTGGTGPAGTPGSTVAGFGLFGAGNAATFALSGVGTTQETIKLYAWANSGETISITASLSDGSASNFTYSGNPGDRFQLTLNAKAASAGQTVTITVSNTQGVEGTFFQAISRA